MEGREVCQASCNGKMGSGVELSRCVSGSSGTPTPLATLTLRGVAVIKNPKTHKSPFSSTKPKQSKHKTTIQKIIIQKTAHYFTTLPE